MPHLYTHSLDMSFFTFFRFSHFWSSMSSFFFFFNDTATTEIYTLSLHDALPIYFKVIGHTSDGLVLLQGENKARTTVQWSNTDRKSTRLNSSHQIISYAVFCLKKKKKTLKTSGSTEAGGGTQISATARRPRAEAS